MHVSPLPCHWIDVHCSVYVQHATREKGRVVARTGFWKWGLTGLTGVLPWMVRWVRDFCPALAAPVRYKTLFPHWPNSSPSPGYIGGITEYRYTQSGNGRFLAYIPPAVSYICLTYDRSLPPSPVGCAPPPSPFLLPSPPCGLAPPTGFPHIIEYQCAI